MALFGELEQELTLDKSQFSSQLDEAEREMNSVGDTAESAGSRFSGMGEKMKSAGMKLSLGVTAPLAAVGAKSLQAASDVEEMQSKMSVVFGNMTGRIKQWAKEQERATGISELQWQEYATTLQDTFKPMGFAQEEASKMSKEVTSLAVDLASFNNMKTDEALSRLQSGLAGNHENFKAFGVLINQSNLDTKLQEMFGVGVKEANEMQKAQARLQLVTEGTSDAHGDAARTAGSFANQMRSLKGQVREAAAQFGQALMPAMKPLIGILKNAVNWFSGLSSEMKTVIAVGAGVAAALGPVLIAVGALIGPLTAGIGAFTGLATAATGLGAALTLLTGPIGIAVAAVAGLAFAYKTNFLGIRDITNQVITAVRATIQGFLSWLTPIWNTHFAAIAAEFQATAAVWRETIQGFIQWARPYVQAFLAALGQFWSQHGTEITGIVRTLTTGLRTLFETAFANIRDLLVGFLRLARGDFEGFGDALLSIVDRTVGAVVDAFRWLSQTLIGNSIIPEMLSAIISAVASWDLGKPFHHAMLRAKSTIEGFISGFRDAGSGLVQALVDGIRSKINAVKNAAQDVASAVDSYMPGSDADEGPLSTLTKSGEALPETFADGIRRSLSDVAFAGEAVATQAAPPLAAVGPGAATAASGGSSGPIVVQLDGDATTDLLRGEAVEVVQQQQTKRDRAVDRARTGEHR